MSSVGSSGGGGKKEDHDRKHRKKRKSDEAKQERALSKAREVAKQENEKRAGYMNVNRMLPMSAENPSSSRHYVEPAAIAVSNCSRGVGILGSNNGGESVPAENRRPDFATGVVA